MNRPQRFEHPRGDRRVVAAVAIALGYAVKPAAAPSATLLSRGGNRTRPSGSETATKAVWNHKRVRQLFSPGSRESRGRRTQSRRLRSENLWDKKNQPTRRSPAQAKRARSKAQREARLTKAAVGTSGQSSYRSTQRRLAEKINNPDWEPAVWQKVNGSWVRVIEQDQWEDPWAYMHEEDDPIDTNWTDDDAVYDDPAPIDRADEEKEELQRLLDEERQKDLIFWAKLDAIEAQNLQD